MRRARARSDAGHVRAVAAEILGRSQCVGRIVVPVLLAARQICVGSVHSGVDDRNGRVGASLKPATAGEARRPDGTNASRPGRLREVVLQRPLSHDDHKVAAHSRRHLRDRSQRNASIPAVGHAPEDVVDVPTHP